MPIKVEIHCAKEHDLTYYVPPGTLGIEILRKHFDNEEPDTLDCDDFSQVSPCDERFCSLCEHCNATEVDL